MEPLKRLCSKSTVIRKLRDRRMKMITEWITVPALCLRVTFCFQNPFSGNLNEYSEIHIYLVMSSELKDSQEKFARKNGDFIIT